MMTIEISGRRRGHGRRKTKRHWTNVRERLEFGGQDVTHPPGTEDRRKEAAAEVAVRPTVVVVVVVVENCRAVDLRRSFSFLTVRWFTLTFEFGSTVTEYCNLTRPIDVRSGARSVLPDGTMVRGSAPYQKQIDGGRESFVF